MTKIPYVQSLGSLDVPPPYHFPNVTVNAFVWETQVGPIQHFCDTVLNLGTDADRGFVYQPAASWPYALLLFIDYPEMISTCPAPKGEPPYSDRGVVKQTEVFVSVPVVRTGLTPRARAFETAVEWALPFIVVGNGMSAVCGREMIGLEKLLADISIGEATYPDSFKGSVLLPGWATLEPGEMQKPDLPFLDVVTQPLLPTFRGSPAQKSLWTLFQNRPIGSLLSGLAAASELVDAAALGLLPIAMRTVSLRQFRDAAEPGLALYQALVTCRSKYTNIANLQFYNENDVKIQFYDTGSFARILRVFMKVQGGSATSPTGLACPVTVKAAFRFNADIDFDDMRTIHTFAVERRGLKAVPKRSDLDFGWARALGGFFGPRKS